ncbi:unnamed protein product [Arctia plantaginis]|uniref:UDP-glucuronosyltransferase n=1 Tax=Arctia plantaginis TaxID=874455 RepID=A0A8S1BAY6_ARCPL|nr:unnamed protein product [Arctia plantaginis]
MLRASLLILLCVQLVPQVEPARILGIFPMPSISHQVVFRALMMELAKRGHELVIITPNPALPKNRPPDNITEIDTSEAYQWFGRIFKDFGNLFKRGAIIDIDRMLNDEAITSMLDIVLREFDLPEVQKLLKDKSLKFDLVFLEAMGNYHLVASHIFNAPVILFSSFGGYQEHLEAMGAVSVHPLYYPSFYRNKIKNLSFFEKIIQIYLEYKIYHFERLKRQKENEALRERFGPDVPSIEEMEKNVQMLFLNSHPIFANNRPVPPSVVYLGALHLQPVKELPQDLKTYLDNSSRGVVYVSLGSNVRPSMMHREFLDVFLNAFEALPYDILWKFDGEDLPKLPKNVKVQKWFPQRDLLVHPKIKVFVTQGGLQSTDEAIASAVPLVGIPMMGDQWYNVNKYVELGIGEELDSYTMTADDLVNAVNKVIANGSYKKNVERLRDVIRDQKEPPLERAVWWTEHVLRHGGAHLRAASAGVTWSEYLMADVIAVVTAAAILALALLVCTCRVIVRATHRSVTVKPKQS